MIILFTKVPTPGISKRRLTDFVSPEQAAEIHRLLLLRCFDAIRDSGISYRIDYSPQTGTERLKSILGNVPMQVQRGDGLGERMYRSFSDMSKDEKRRILVGSDLPDINAELLLEADELLKTHDVVISPAEDGGYGLIGMNRLHRELFDIPEYSTPTVLEETVRAAEKAGLRVALTRSIRDLDTKEDLVAFATGHDSARLLGQGEYNVNFLLEGSPATVLRINKASQMHLGDRQLPYEYHALKLLKNSGVTPVPLSFREADTLLPFPSLIMEYVEGRPLDYRTDLSLAARLLATVHNVKLPEEHGLIPATHPFRLMHEECREMFSVYRNWNGRSEEVVRRMDELFEAQIRMGLDDPIERPCLINTELNNTNFIIGEHPVIIDWEKPLYGEREQDLAHFTIPTTTFFRTDVILTSEEIENFLEEYAVYSSFNRKKFDKYFVFTCLRGLTWCAMAQVEYAGERFLRNEATERKIEAYLSVEFLENIRILYEKALN